jgi:alanyl-tRNA synthetase
VEQKLYYHDAYLKNFSAKMVKQEQDESGNWFIVLEQTAFYPTGGGQPFDTGTLNDLQVHNVEEIDGEVRHYLEASLPHETKEVIGQINWERRFDHMQQHAGQHILSAAFEGLFGYKTIGFHLGKEVLTIDLDTDDLTLAQAGQAEALANQIILENRPIEAKWVSEDEIDNFQLRKELSVSEDIRLVIIPDFDYNGCGGTHPNTTGQVGSLKILDWERQKKKIRVQFVCGGRVLVQLGQKQGVLKELSPLLNAPEADMVVSVKKLVQSVKERDKALAEAQDLLLQYEAREIIKSETIRNGAKVVSQVFQNQSIQELQKLGRMIVNESDDIVVFLVSENEGRLQLVCARGVKAEGNMKQVISEVLPLINGKGGGGETFAQGGGDATMSGERLLEEILNKL